MKIAEMKSAVDAGKTVHWANEGYLVHKDDLGQYLITYQPNGSTIGLTGGSGERPNGDEADFFVACPDLGVTIHCAGCDGEDVMRDGWATWNAELQLWESADLQDHAWCNACDSETKLVKRAIRDHGGSAGHGGSRCVDNEFCAAAENGGVARTNTEHSHPGGGSG